ncbi:MarR family transcriptional regulator [Novosphingobium sp. KN65.2]|uniref:MarR family transcriptional regulator n=1 Tax=Novosphingobium sp. KN65.2 TaxID=1478134 RepID=UPI0005E24EB0|nr:MarR family transcriptional regulator [Novosphingobium sp. KN65.2]CDO37109.1 conserved hypothetical protein [Novosphingobium sp. KN65.2]
MAATDFAQSDFSYGKADGGSGPAGNGDTGQSVSISIFANRGHLRASLREDAAAAGLTVSAAGPLQDIVDAPLRALGDVVLLDCPQVDGKAMATLSELDQRAASGGCRLIVSTTVDALDAVFACMDQSAPILLVDPNRAERVLALGRVLAEFPQGRLRELSENDRLMLLRLTEQVSQIAGRIERLAPGASPAPASAASAFSFEPAGSQGQARGAYAGREVARPTLPDAQMVRQIIRLRQLRGRFLDEELFADPAWDMLLDLTAARLERKRVSVTSLCIASGVPPTTALRWIGQMVEAGLFVRVCDDSDRRRAFIELTEPAVDAMARYFSEVSLAAPAPV